MKKFTLSLFAASCFVLLVACATPLQNATPTRNSPTAMPSPNSARLISPTAPNAANAPTAANFPTPPPNVQAQLGEKFVLRVGQTAILTDTPDQFGITFYNVADDSRCPQGVACVWAGEVVVQITFQENGLLHPPIVELTTNPQDDKNVRVIEGYRVELLDVQPPMVSGKPIAMADYQAAFSVTRAEETPTPVSNAATGALNEPLNLKFFQSVDFPQANLRVTLNSILEDSRCPKQVSCAQAGRALLGITLERKNDIAFFQLSTMPPDGRTRAYFQGYAVELLNVAPYPETLEQKLEPRDYLVTVVVREMNPPTTVKKNEGFVLKVGEKATIVDENVQVKFVNVTGDSRCPWMASCAVRGNAVVEALFTQADGTEQKFILNEDSSKPNQRIPDTGNFALELVALAPYPRVMMPPQEIPQQAYEATFVVRKFASTQHIPTKTPTGLSITNCLGLTQQDAEAIAGEPMEIAPRAHVPIQVPMDKEIAARARGLCGFVSVAKNERDVIVLNEPHTAEVEHIAAVTAARLTGVEAWELARIASIVHFANPDAALTPYLILQTRLTAGDWQGIFSSFQELTDSADVQFERVDRFGDEGLWIWRAGILTNYAALLVRDGDAFVVLEALLPKRINEAAAKESIHAVAGKMW